MIGMQDRLQWFRIHVNQEIGLNWKAFQLAIVPEIARSPSYSLELVIGPQGDKEQLASPIGSLLDSMGNF